MISEKDNVAKFLAEYVMRCSILCKKFCKVILFWCHESSRRRVTNGTELNGLNLFSRIRWIVELGLRRVFIAEGRSHFLNKTDFEQSLFNPPWNRSWSNLCTKLGSTAVFFSTDIDTVSTFSNNYRFRYLTSLAFRSRYSVFSSV